LPGIISDKLFPEGDSVRKAVKWINSELKAGNIKTVHLLVEEACLRFNLSPSDAMIIEKSFRHPEQIAYL